MAKKKIKKNDSYFNTYSLGSRMNTVNRGIGASELGGAIGGSGGLSSIANAASSTVSGLINPKGNSTGVGNAIQDIGSIASNIPGIGGVIGAGINLVGGLVNAAFGSNLNEEFIAQTEDMTKQQAGYTSAAQDNSSLLNDWASYTDMAHVRKSDVGSDGWFSNKAKNKTKSLNRAIDSANLKAWHSLDNTASNVDTNNDLLAMANFSAYGGPIFSTGAIGYDLASRDLNNKQLKALSGMRLTSLPNSFNTFPDITTANTFSDGGGIHIKPENKGKFTTLKNRTGKSATWFKEHGTPAQRKMATFALNAKKWKHADGGELHTQGGDFTNGLTYIDNGGSHETNPFEGVQIGIDPQGVPNLVEEGEVIFNDYVFSNRMKLPKKLKKEYSIKGETFADAAKELSKESEERPNDPISKRGLGAFMNALTESQEEVRTKKEERNMNGYAKGGKLGNLFSGPGDSPQYMSRAAAKRARYKVDTDKTYTTIPVDDNAKGNGKYNLSYLRFAPAIMSGVSAFTDLFSKPDYSAADRVASIDIQPALVSADPIGQYLSYRPLDRMFYINQLDKNTASGRRAVQNTTGGNRAAALAGVLAADYNYGENLGQLARQAEEYNQAQRERVATFNKATDMFNSQQSMQAQATNAQSINNATQMRLAQAEKVAQLRQAARDAYNARRSNNLNSFITNLGNIGWEEKQAEWLDNLAKRGVLLMNTSGEYTGGTKKNGGKLKKKRRTTYA